MYVMLGVARERGKKETEKRGKEEEEKSLPPPLSCHYRLSSSFLPSLLSPFSWANLIASSDRYIHAVYVEGGQGKGGERKEGESQGTRFLLTPLISFLFSGWTKKGLS